MLINKESYDATIEETKRTVKNIKSAQKSERSRCIKIIKSHIANTYPINCKTIIDEITYKNEEAKNG